jgi:hypothetical protein
VYGHTTTAASAMVWCGVKGVPHCLHLSTCLGPSCTRWWAACTASCGVPLPAGLLLHAAQGGGPTRKAHTLAPPSSQFACCGAWPALLSVCLACLLGLPGPALRLPCFGSQLLGVLLCGQRCSSPGPWDWRGVAETQQGVSGGRSCGQLWRPGAAAAVEPAATLFLLRAQRQGVRPEHCWRLCPAQLALACLAACVWSPVKVAGSAGITAATLGGASA